MLARTQSSRLFFTPEAPCVVDVANDFELMSLKVPN
jgi:hypothetical protein